MGVSTPSFGRVRVAITAALLVLSTAAALSAADATSQIRSALDNYCVRCHGAEKQKGERRFDLLKFPLPDSDSAILAQDVIDQLVLGDMPPQKADQPSEKEKLALIENLRSQTQLYHDLAKSAGGETTLRRLNHREYRNTVRDLLGINLDMFDPTRKFPRDQTAEHFDNVGDVLVTSGYLLDQYLDAADQVVEKAFTPRHKPEVKTWHFTAPFKQQPELIRAHQKAYGSKYLCIHEAINSDRHWGEYAPILKFRDGVPTHGRYEIELLVEAKSREHPHPKSKVDIDKDEPMWLGVIPGNFQLGELHNPQPYEKVLAKIAIPDGEPKWQKTTVWLDKGFTPRFIYINGPSGARSLHSGIGLKLLKKEGKGNNPFGAHYIKTLMEGELPHIRIHEIKIRGPIYDEQWPPASQRAALGPIKGGELRIEDIVRRFASRAYRRPVKEDELARLMAITEKRKAAGGENFDALKDTLKAVLCSPSFLYLDEQTESADNKRLTDAAFASRLSYFLWSSMPDEELLAAASKGDLREPGELRAQVRRMLADEKSAAFYEGFLDSWLALRDLGGMPPDRRQFGVYYKKNLRPLMLEETRRFTRHLVEENLSLLNFLDSDFTFANKTLAQFYGLPSMKGYEFQKVLLTGEQRKRRGGLLGQSGVLTVTANGIETSPVTRGVWVLENIFGTIPPPPPDDVEPLDPDIRGAKTIRDQLAKHRDTPACNECHRKIDPPGFALESFDPIGSWRSKYPNRVAVDASGEFPNGDRFKDMVEFKKVLMQREDVFTRTVIEKLLTYGAGRRIEALDRPEVDRLLAKVKKSEHRLGDTLLHVIESPIFQSR